MKLFFYIIILFAGIAAFAQEKEKKELSEADKILKSLESLTLDSLVMTYQGSAIHSNMPMVKSESKDPMPVYTPPDSIDYKIGKYKVDVKGDSTQILKLPGLKKD